MHRRLAARLIILVNPRGTERKEEAFENDAPQQDEEADVKESRAEGQPPASRPKPPPPSETPPPHVVAAHRARMHKMRRKGHEEGAVQEPRGKPPSMERQGAQQGFEGEPPHTYAEGEVVLPPCQWETIFD